MEKTTDSTLFLPRAEFPTWSSRKIYNLELRASTRRGVSLIEVIVASAVLFLALTGLVTAYNMFVRAGVSTVKTIQVSYLLEEGVEAVSSMRDFGWAANIANLTSGSNYYLSWNGSRWLATSTVSKIETPIHVILLWVL